MTALKFVFLGDIADVNWGDTSVTKASYVPVGYPAFSATGCDGFLPYADHERDAVVLSAIGARCGKTWHTSGKWSCIKNTIRFWSIVEDVDNRYLYWATSDESIWPKRGAAQPFITIGDARRIKIPVLPLPEQRRIAEILDKVEALRTKRRTALAKLDTLAQSIFLDLFCDTGKKLGKFSCVELSAACNSADDIKCGPFGTQLSKSEFSLVGTPLWGIKNVNARFEIPAFDFIPKETAERLRQYSIDPGDIVMTRKGTIGNCAVYPAHFSSGIMHSDLLRIRVSSSICDPVFLSHQLHYSKDVERQISLISGGAVMPGINVTKLKSLKILLPSIKIQSLFSEQIAAIEVLKERHRASLAQLDALFASLQHRAFRGEL